MDDITTILNEFRPWVIKRFENTPVIFESSVKEGDTRGTLTFDKDGKPILTFYLSLVDRKTFIHETMHLIDIDSFFTLDKDLGDPNQLNQWNAIDFENYLENTDYIDTLKNHNQNLLTDDEISRSRVFGWDTIEALYEEEQYNQEIVARIAGALSIDCITIQFKLVPYGILAQTHLQKDIVDYYEPVFRERCIIT